jgi:LysM repeat protein
MQRDMKVGLAVGVALIGIVGALFFRREPEGRDRDAPPPMKDTKEIDRLIGEKGKTPYMDGIEEYPDRVAPVPPPQNPLAKSKGKPDGDDAPKFGNTDDGRKRERNPQKVVPAPVPAQPLGDSPLAGDPAYAHNRDWEPAGPTGPAVKKAAEAERPGATGTTGNAPRTHVIQAGETLSGLAARYLGSSARFREIYEANRNVLRSPDDLRDGVTIVIPDGGKSRDVQHASGAGTSSSNNAVKAQSASARSNADGSNSTAAAASPGDAPREKIRFAPVKGGPFSAGRAAPQAGTAKSKQATDDNASP